MKCTSTEVEIETLVSRIKKKDLNLRPDFQRGEIWSDEKKRKLIDSILRGWKIPPVHFIENPELYYDEVLDGQQRLAAIRDFLGNQLSIDGNIEPHDLRIKKLHGKFFEDLDDIEQRKIKKYGVVVIRLTEYLPEEPSELFFRLNQPSLLTSAEKRNSYVGITRNQIKKLVENFEEVGASKETIGFSNSRMAYDDVVSKLCYALEVNTLKKKITSTNISERYREDTPFSEDVVKNVEQSLDFFMRSILDVKDEFQNRLSINKATLFSWLIFSLKNSEFLTSKQMGELIYVFELTREYIKGKRESVPNKRTATILEEAKLLNQYILLFNQRASMGSTDANSIIYRDIILEIFLAKYFENEVEDHFELNSLLSKEQLSVSKILENISEEYNWGGELLHAD